MNIVAVITMYMHAWASEGLFPGGANSSEISFQQLRN